MNDLISRLISAVGDGEHRKFLYTKREGERRTERYLERAREVGAVLAHDPITGQSRNQNDILNDALKLTCGSDFYLCPLHDAPARFYAVVVTDSK